MTKYFLLLLISITSALQAENTQFIYVNAENVMYHIKPENVDKLLRDIPAEKLEQAMQYIALNPVQIDNGEYILHAHVRGFGGGGAGAVFGFWLGKGLIYTVGHGTIIAITTAVSTVNPVAGAFTGKVLESTLAGPIELASNTVGLALGITFGAGTGPV